MRISDQNITFRSLPFLNENDIKEAIKDIGHRAEFRVKLVQWQNENVILY